MIKPVKVRFAPSPTGDPHVGGVRTALFSWLFARQHGGVFVLRIEDTDRERFQKGSVEKILESLEWLGLNWDEGPFFQSERTELYRKYASRLIEKKKAYYCFCSRERLEKLRIDQSAAKQPPRYDKRCLKLTDEEVAKNLEEKKPAVIRLNIPPEGSTEFTDLIRGKVKFENKVLDDSILLKSDNFPTYHLANVVDDYEMGITHVIRAEEWLPSTPKHILLYNFLGLKPPQFAHLPLILGRDKKKLSKRQGAVSVFQYKKDGYLPEAMINFLALLGWNPKNDEEIFSKEELIKNFSLAAVNKAGAVFDLDKLNWLNGLYLRQKNVKELAALGNPYLKKEYLALAKQKNIDLLKLWQTARERISTLKEINSLCDFVFEEIGYDPALLIPQKGAKNATLKALKIVREKMAQLSKEEADSPESLREIFLALIKEKGLKTGEVLWPFRVALSGKQASPDVFDLASLFGREKTLEKIDQAIAWLENL